mmetsp:Transcript_9580/g.28783  ORF Transcript_9580/g.28783 Transcript_9580/m.28783 type:complete len:305 (-) Transcript_9580:137-1051(-)
MAPPMARPSSLTSYVSSRAGRTPAAAAASWSSRQRASVGAPHGTGRAAEPSAARRVQSTERPWTMALSRWFTTVAGWMALPEAWDAAMAAQLSPAAKRWCDTSQAFGFLDGLSTASVQRFVEPAAGRAIRGPAPDETAAASPKPNSATDASIVFASSAARAPQRTPRPRSASAVVGIAYATFLARWSGKTTAGETSSSAAARPRHANTRSRSASYLAARAACPPARQALRRRTQSSSAASVGPAPAASSSAGTPARFTPASSSSRCFSAAAAARSASRRRTNSGGGRRTSARPSATAAPRVDRW